MPTFQSKPLGRGGSGKAEGTLARLVPKVRQHPFLLFGAPFVLTIVAASYGLSTLTQSRYDYNASKVQSVSKEQELQMRKDRRRIDIREEYFRLQAKESELDEWEPKRIARPEGIPEWGVAPITESTPPPTRQERSERDQDIGKKREPSILRKVYADERPAGVSDTASSAGARANTSSRAKTVLGPDGKPCRACNSKLAFSAAMKGTGAPKMPGTPSKASAGPAAVATAGLAEQATDLGTASQCPPDGELLGHSTWIFLHSAAAYYPQSPSQTQQSAMLSMIHALPHLYPCHSCAESLGSELQREQRQGASWQGGAVLEQAVRSGPALRKWLCGLHNEVNERLGKPTFRCDEEMLRTRWLDGPDDGSCD